MADGSAYAGCGRGRGWVCVNVCLCLCVYFHVWSCVKKLILEQIKYFVFLALFVHFVFSPRPSRFVSARASRPRAQLPGTTLLAMICDILD